MKNNFHLLRANFHPVSSNPFHIGDWNTFLELSKSAKMIWRTGVGTKIEVIDLTTDSLEKLYVFTDEFPAEGIIDLIYPLETPYFRTADVQGNPNLEQINIITVSISEIQLTKEIETCFWKRVLDAIDHGKDTDGFEHEFKNRIPNIKHLPQRSFKEIVNSLTREEHAKLLIGRIFLLNLILSDSNADNFTRQFVLYMFVDKGYFVKAIIDGMGLDCEQQE